MGWRLSGSLANATRLAYVQGVAPFCHASDSDTRWSTSTSLAPPRTNTIVLAVYGSARVPAITLHEPDIVRSVRVLMSMSLRVSQPLRSTSTHAGPNISRA